ncbi:Transient receptor putative cation channel sub V member 2, partial [Physocladia obscura]
MASPSQTQPLTQAAAPEPRTASAASAASSFVGAGDIELTAVGKNGHTHRDFVRSAAPKELNFVPRNQRFTRYGSSHTFIQEITQLQLFSDNNLWEALFVGDLDSVKSYAQEPFTVEDETTGESVTVGRRGECERGGEGETILHLAVLLKHKHLIKWIVPTFPSLVNEVYLKRRYFGETPLHIAVVNSTWDDDEVVRLLVENGYLLYTSRAKINGPMVTGKEFLKDEDKGCLYYGQTILQFACANHRNKLVKYLVENEHDPAELDTVDIYGNNCLHIMAHYGDFDIQVFNYLKLRNLSDIAKAIHKGDKPPMDLMRARNKDNLTPFQVGISRGHANIIEAVKELEWEFGYVRHYRVCIDDLDPIQPHIEAKNGGGERISKSALEIAADRQDKAIINHPLFEALLKVKWALYVRSKFLFRFINTVILILSFTIAIALQPYSLEDRRTYSVASAGNLYPIERGVFEVISIAGVVIMLLGEAREFYIERGTYFTGYGSGENIVQWTFSVCILVIPILRFGIAAAVSSTSWFYILDTENIITGFAAILGWIYLLNFAKGFKAIGPLIIVFKKILTEDLIQWLSLYLAVTAGFAAALFLQMNDAPIYSQLDNDNIKILDWNNYLGAVLWTIRFIFAQGVFDDLRHSKLPGFTEFLFVAYGFLVMVLLVNVLIAKLVETYKEIAKDSKRVWTVQFAYLIIDMDQKLSRSEKEFLLKHVGWHLDPDEAKNVVTPRYFLFTERDVPDPKDPKNKMITETLKLVVARDHMSKDIEVNVDGDHWYGWMNDLAKSFQKMKRDHQHGNLWHDHAMKVDNQNVEISKKRR